MKPLHTLLVAILIATSLVCLSLSPQSADAVWGERHLPPNSLNSGVGWGIYRSPSEKVYDYYVDLVEGQELWVKLHVGKFDVPGAPAGPPGPITATLIPPVGVTPSPIDRQTSSSIIELSHTAASAQAGRYRIRITSEYQFVYAKLAWSVTDRPDMDARIARIEGIDRYKTSIEASQWAWGSGEATTCILATGAKYPDALTASSLSGAYDAPVLLTTSTYSHSRAFDLMSEMLRLGCEKVFIVGDWSVVPEAYVDRLEKPESGITSPDGRSTIDWPGVEVQRIGGKNRYETARLVAAEAVSELERRGGYDGTVFFAAGMNFPDALAAAAYASSQGIPILLNEYNSEGNTQVIASIGATQAVVVGGADVVPDWSADALGIPYIRIGGADRYETSAILSEYAMSQGWIDGGLLGLATGWSYPDSLSGGAAVGRFGGALLLTSPIVMRQSTSDYIGAARPGVTEMPVFGGIDALSGEITSDAHELIQ